MSKSDTHVLPIADLREHEQSRACWCQPRCEQQVDWHSALVIHNSMDGRELVEDAGPS